MPGYDRSKIVGLNDEELDEFICGICLGVFADPIMTECCRQTYCKDCIEDWVLLNKNCPNDRQILTKEKLKLVPTALINFIGNMKIKCNLEAEGCSKLIRICELAQHLPICDFRPNQICKTCGLMQERVLTHNCIKSLICEKQKSDEKYLQLFNENSILQTRIEEKDENISSLQSQLDQSEICHKSAFEATEQKFEEKILQLMNENSSLTQIIEENSELILDLRDQLAQFEKYKKASLKFKQNSEEKCSKLFRENSLIFSKFKAMDAIIQSHQDVIVKSKISHQVEYELLKQKSQEKYNRLLKERSSLTKIVEDNIGTIAALKNQLAHFKQNSQNLNEGLMSIKANLQENLNIQ